MQITPVYRATELQTITQLSVLFYNDCLFLSHHLTHMNVQFRLALLPCEAAATNALSDVSFVDLVGAVKSLGIKYFVMQLSLTKSTVLEAMRTTAPAHTTLSTASAAAAAAATRVSAVVSSKLTKLSTTGAAGLAPPTPTGVTTPHPTINPPSPALSAMKPSTSPAPAPPLSLLSPLGGSAGGGGFGSSGSGGGSGGGGPFSFDLTDVEEEARRQRCTTALQKALYSINRFSKQLIEVIARRILIESLVGSGPPPKQKSTTTKSSASGSAGGSGGGGGAASGSSSAVGLLESCVVIPFIRGVLARVDISEQAAKRIHRLMDLIVQYDFFLPISELTAHMNNWKRFVAIRKFIDPVQSLGMRPFGAQLTASTPLNIL